MKHHVVSQPIWHRI